MAYKFKPNKAVAKRFKVSKTGKLKRHQQTQAQQGRPRARLGGQGSGQRKRCRRGEMNQLKIGN